MPEIGTESQVRPSKGAAVREPLRGARLGQKAESRCQQRAWVPGLGSRRSAESALSQRKPQSSNACPLLQEVGQEGAKLLVPEICAQASVPILHPVESLSSPIELC